jgi:hypothetical protein
MRRTVPVPVPSDLATFKITHALRKLLSDLSLGRAVYLRPPELHALGDRALEPVADHRQLKFGKGAS